MADAAPNHRAILVENIHSRLKASVDEIRTLVREVIRGESMDPSYVGIILCGHEYHGDLHFEYRGSRTQTDVLAFPLSDGDSLEGEVYVDLDTAFERHSEFGATFDQEVARYVVHGLLHLAGYSDTTAAGRRVMRQKEDEYLAILDVSGAGRGRQPG